MNINDIAQLAGVSVATVSRVINNSGVVREATREKIEKVIAESNFVPNAMARSLSTNSCSNIGVAFPDIQNHFFSSMLRGITQKSVDCGYNVYFYDTDENTDYEHRFLATVQEQRFKGIIMTPVTEHNSATADMIANLEKSGIPVIIVDRDIMNVETDGIFFEDAVGSYRAVKCLIDAGHQHIATITGPQTMKPGRERLSGYINAVQGAGIELNEEYMVNGYFLSDGGYKAARQLLELPTPPTAIFTANNLMTLGCLKYFREKGIKIGRDIAMVGYDEIEELTIAGYSITTVERPTIKMGEEAVHLLQQRFEDPKSLGRVHNRITVATNLIVRGSEKINGGI